MEVTSVDESLPRAKCHERGHVHLEDVVEHCDAFAENEVCACLCESWELDAVHARSDVQAVLFMHFSQRYKASTITTAIKEKLPDWLLRKVTAAVGDLGPKEETEVVPMCE